MPATLARVVMTPDGLAWQLCEPTGGRLRRTLVVEVQLGFGRRELARLPVERQALGDHLVVRAEGLVRRPDPNEPPPWHELDGGPR